MDFNRDWSMIVGGERRSTAGEERLTVTDPATGDIVANVPAGTETDVDRAVAAARDASEWGSVPPQARAGTLFEAADAIDSHREELVELEIAENGKPLEQAKRDVRRAVEYVRFYAWCGDNFHGDAVRNDTEGVYSKVFEPYGVAGIVIPWNWPPLHTAQFVAAATAAGNTVVLKPAPETPLSSLRIGEILRGVLPDGVLNVVPGGTEPGVAVTSHEDVDMVAFTGHHETGTEILRATAADITPSLLELGGKNPEIVFPDADLHKAIPTAVCNAFYNSGQACSDTERLLLHERIYEKFLAEFVSITESLVVDDGRAADAQIGPITHERQYEKIQRYLDSAREEGDVEMLGRPDLPTDPSLAEGNWVAPTVLRGVESDMNIAQEEVFGPVVSVIPFETEEEAVDLANGVEFGLNATVWTNDLNRAHRLCSRLEAGTIAVNDRGGSAHGLPSGGFKRSGIGRKGDFVEMMREFSRVKAIHIDITDQPTRL